jgi:hypothetical protein
MDAFEDLVARILKRDGYWAIQNYKVELNKAEKRQIGTPSMPRPDIDILAYRASTNTIYWIECKSSLDSTGVMAVSLTEGGLWSSHYKLFNDDSYRKIVTQRLLRQLRESGQVATRPKIRYWLIAGHFAGDSQKQIQAQFRRRGWLLSGPDWLQLQLEGMADDPYTNDVVTMAMKIHRSS